MTPSLSLGPRLCTTNRNMSWNSANLTSCVDAETGNAMTRSIGTCGAVDILLEPFTRGVYRVCSCASAVRVESDRSGKSVECDFGPADSMDSSSRCQTSSWRWSWKRKWKTGSSGTVKNNVSVLNSAISQHAPYKCSLSALTWKCFDTVKMTLYHYRSFQTILSSFRLKSSGM